MNRSLALVGLLAGVALAGSLLPGCSGGSDGADPSAAAAAGTAAAGQRQQPPGPPPGMAYMPPEPGSYELPVIQRAADGVVLDADGTPRRLSEYLEDKIVLMSFVYLSCKDATACPLAMAGFHLIEMDVKADPVLHDRVRLVTMSFDPTRDTPEAMLEHGAWNYLDTPWQRRSWSLLTCASPGDLKPILDGYGQTIVPEFDEQGRRTGDFLHVMKVFLIDRQQRVRNIYGSGFLHPALALADLRTLAMEEG